MSETEHEDEATEPTVTPVPEPDQPGADEEEEAESEQAETHDTEPEPEPGAQHTTPEAWEKRFQLAERRFKTYADAVTKAWEEDALSLVQFNLDPAAPPGFIDMRNKGHVEDDTKAAALGFLGFDTEAGMESDPYSHLCKTCKGWGEVVTGSKVANNDTRQCLDCKGRGYIADEDAQLVPIGSVEPGPQRENGVLVPAATGVESPEVESLRRRGFTIIPPMQTNP